MALTKCKECGGAVAEMAGRTSEASLNGFPSRSPECFETL